MGIIEIVLIILGVVVFIGSFLLPAGKDTQAQISEQLNEETIREKVEKELEVAKGRIDDIVDETITYAIEKTERSMDRLTNEKMMAVNEYSDTVLEEINKNHKEVVFLYDMLNDKHENIKTTVSEVDKKVSEVKQTVKDAEILAKEMESNAEEAIFTVHTAPAPPAASVPHTSVKSHMAVPEPVTAVPEFKPMEAKKVDVVYRPLEVEKVEETANVIGGESALPVEQAADTLINTAVSAPVDLAAGKTEKLPENVPAKVPADVTESVPAGETGGVLEVEVTLDAAGRPGNRNSNERILELHKMGKSNMAIAKELGLGIGEVKLVIDLFEGQ